MVQVNNTPIVLRVKFYKVGSLQYISHLDLVRTMHKIIVRAKLPLWYTEGFNPKPKMIFAAPLSVGCESRCEYVDIRLTERMDTDLAVKSLNDNLTNEMQVISAYYPDTKLTDLKWLEYLMEIKTADASEALAKRCEQMLSQSEILVHKKNKKDEPAVNISPLIKSAKVELDGECIIIRTVLSADNSSFLNPEYVITALKEGCGILSDPVITNEYYSILRTRALREDMTEFE